MVTRVNSSTSTIARPFSRKLRESGALPTVVVAKLDNDTHGSLLTSGTFDPRVRCACSNLLSSLFHDVPCLEPTGPDLTVTSAFGQLELSLAFRSGYAKLG